MTVTSAPAGARARVRAELTREIKAIAREQLSEVGAAALSLRAVAREMNMASSAVYRYFPSRDELLTALIVDAYDAVGAAAELDEADVRRTDYAGRWVATARAVREWAVTHPQEFALIYGSPVPGYQAPQDTIDPAARIPLLLLGIVNDCAEAGKLSSVPEQPMPKVVRADLMALAEQAAPHLDPHQSGQGRHGLRRADRSDQLRAVRPSAQRHPRLRGALRLPAAPGRRRARTAPAVNRSFSGAHTRKNVSMSTRMPVFARDPSTAAYYEQRAAEYDDWYTGDGRFRERDRPGWHDAVAEIVALVSALPAARTLDVACGSGFLTRHLKGLVRGIGPESCDGGGSPIAAAARRGDGGRRPLASLSRWRF